MADEREEYKFPDEAETSVSIEGDALGEEKVKAKQDVSDDLEINIEDDTPLQDRGRKPLPKKMVEELENDGLEEYSDKVKKRLSQMKKVWHDERREKEAALREKEEVLRFAHARETELKQVKDRATKNEKAFLREVAKYADYELVIAKEKLKQAYDSGDSELITNAQEKLTDAKLRLQNLQRYQPSLQETEERVEQSQQVQAPQSAPESQADPKASVWRENNTWFGVDEEMTALALGLHEKLVRSGIDPRTDEYYHRVDENMRKRFPEAFDDVEEEEKTQTKQAQKPVRAKPATVVAPVTRGTAPRQVRLTSSQVAIAKKLGLSNEQYAKAMIQLENGNG